MLDATKREMSAVPLCRDMINDAFYPLLKDETPLQISFGGSSSGKSVFDSDRAVIDVLNGGRNYLITRKVQATIKSSVFNEVGKSIERLGASSAFTANKSEFSYTCSNRYQILFKGLDDAQKVKSVTPIRGVITDIWMEEATENTEDDYDLLDKRLRGIDPEYPDIVKRMGLSLNPIIKTHWIYTRFLAHLPLPTGYGWLYRGPDIVVLKTTYRDNKFLTPDDIKRIESEKNEYYRAVYVDGEWGVLGDVIFNNWRVDDLSEIADQFGTYRNGLDFGFVHPCAVVRTASRDNKLYITDGFYECGLTNSMIADRLKPIVGDETVYCDSAEPKSIAELRIEGIDAEPATKGPGSIAFGIKNLQSYDEIVVDQQLQWLVNELMTYQRRKNKWGESMEEPVDKNNHAIDATRYAREGENEQGPRAWVL